MEWAICLHWDHLRVACYPVAGLKARNRKGKGTSYGIHQLFQQISWDLKLWVWSFGDIRLGFTCSPTCWCCYMIWSIWSITLEEKLAFCKVPLHAQFSVSPMKQERKHTLYIRHMIFNQHSLPLHFSFSNKMSCLFILSMKYAVQLSMPHPINESTT